MRKNELFRTAIFVYQNWLFVNYYDLPFSLCVERIALFLGLERKTVSRHLKILKEKGFLFASYATRKNADGDVVMKWAVTVYARDPARLALLEDFILMNEGSVPSLENSLSVMKDFADFQKAASSALNKGVSKKEVSDVCNKKISAARDRKKALTEKKIASHVAVFDVSPWLSVVNEVYGEDFIRYLDQGLRRYYSDACHTPNPEKHDCSARLDYVKKVLGCDYVSHVDKTASTFSLSEAFGTKQIPDWDEDTYRKVFEKSGISFTRVSDDEWAKIRPDLKYFFQPTYMSEQSIRFSRLIKLHGSKKADGSFSGCYEKNGSVVLSDDKKFEAGTLKGRDLEEYQKALRLEKRFGKSIYEICCLLRDGMKRVFGIDKFLSDEIFFWESDLYLMCMAEMWKRFGVKCVPVFDCFYYDAEIADFEEKFKAVYVDCLSEMLSDEKVDARLNEIRHVGAWSAPKIRMVSRRVFYDLPEQKICSEDEIRKLWDEVEKGIREVF